MQTTAATTVDIALALGAMAWPLAAGLSIVMWSKVRARQAQAVRVRARTTRR
ncbi:hypothetical protein LRS10_14465 [Phenylobacterium sp. J426]|uniref:hypothetical protein n=1 Tax=Phenylobacterium sp. J426 TaxID=2898439 RepID=UPI00215125A8|nr:hypothetical protein [Phenylobacterium sp. J426]MCR5875282.1 hypothetical protein [Phenylobacterium sp. J426]